MVLSTSPYFIRSAMAGCARQITAGRADRFVTADGRHHCSDRRKIPSASCAACRGARLREITSRSVAQTSPTVNLRPSATALFIRIAQLMPSSSGSGVFADATGWRIHFIFSRQMTCSDRWPAICLLLCELVQGLSSAILRHFGMTFQTAHAATSSDGFNIEQKPADHCRMLRVRTTRAVLPHHVIRAVPPDSGEKLYLRRFAGWFI